MVRLLLVTLVFSILLKNANCQEPDPDFVVRHVHSRPAPPPPPPDNTRENVIGLRAPPPTSLPRHIVIVEREQSSPGQNSNDRNTNRRDRGFQTLSRERS